MIGKSLGPYEIVESLGAGGMGEVYRARDTTLQRDIAIKILPAELAADPERLGRFRQEARLLAGVHHANIAAVYGLEDIDGVQFFTQELVRGHTLGTRIKEGHLDLEDIISIGAQMADALETAHSHGIVHRDLKPANVMTTNDGRVKVLDFGLARPVTTTEDAKPSGESTPTISTVRPEGVVLGTAAYMSPDQARGRNVDHRGDIWAFGCVMYELLAGRKAFEGETLLDTLSDVVRGEPDWDAIPAATPPRLVRLVKRCLRKKLRDRLQSMGDARIELQEMLNEPAFGVVAPAATVLSPSRTPRGRMSAYLAIAGIVGVAIGAGGSRLLSAPAPRAARATVHASLPVPEDARLVGDISVTLAVSPDGSHIAYVAMVNGVQRLFLQSVVDFSIPEPLPGTEHANNPFFSPDGAWLGYFVQNRNLMKMPTSGGASFPICEVPTGNHGATWLEDDTIIFAPAFTGEGLMRVPAAGGSPEPVTTLDSGRGELGQRRPQVLADGRHVLFTTRSAVGGGAAVLSLESGETRLVLADALDASWVPTGHLLFSRNGTLFGIRFDMERLETVGPPVPLLSGLYTDRDSGEARFALSGDGNLVFMPGEIAASAEQLAWVERDGSVELLGAAPGDYGHPRVSPDGKTVAVDRMEGGRGDIWAWNVERRSFTRLTNSGDNRMPVWSDNGLRIVFASNTGGATGIYWRHADGSGDHHEIIVAGYSLWPRAWNKDAIVYYELNPDTGRDIWSLSGIDVLDADGNPTAPAAHPVVQTPANERAPALSPDGRWIAYVSDGSGRDEIYVEAFGGDPQRHTISSDGGGEPVWSSDGSELFYRSGRGMYAVPVSTDGGFTAGAPQLLFEGDFASDRMGSNQYFDVHGERFLMILADPTGGVPDHLHVIVDFAESLRTLAE